MKSIRDQNNSALLQNDVSSRTDWSHELKLSFKGVKCVHLQFCRGTQEYQIDDQDIMHKDLGLIVLWNSHYNHITSRLDYRFGSPNIQEGRLRF